jgi:hypothetical protein
MLSQYSQEKNWASLNEIYTKLESMGEEALNSIPKEVSSAATIHRLGAEASRTLGDMQNWRQRLWRAKTSLDTAVGGINDPFFGQILADLEYIDKTFGSVTIAPRSKWTSKKRWAQMKWKAVLLSSAPAKKTLDEVKSINFAEQVIKDTGSFTGLLPAGLYWLEDGSFIAKFTVEAGPTERTGKKPTKVSWGK